MHIILGLIYLFVVHFGVVLSQDVVVGFEELSPNTFTYGDNLTNANGDPGIEGRDGGFAWLGTLPPSLNVYAGAGTGYLLGDLLKFDLSTKAWSLEAGTIDVNANSSSLTPLMPGTRSYFGACKATVGGSEKIFIYGGNGYGNFSRQAEILRDFWSYDIATKTFTALPSGDNPGGNPVTNFPAARHSYNAHCIDNVGFIVFGGFGQNYTGSLGSMNDLWMFDFQIMSWKYLEGSNATRSFGDNIPNVPKTRSGYVSWIDSTTRKLYIYGGRGYDAANQPLLYEDIWEFSINTTTWTLLYNPIPGRPQNPPARMNSASFYENTFGLLFMFGGHLTADDAAIDFTNDLWYFSTKNNNWTQVFGKNAGFVIVSTKQGNVQFNVPSPRYKPQIAFAESVNYLVNGNSSLYGYLFGGFDETGERNDVWKVTLTVSAIASSTTLPTTALAPSTTTPTRPMTSTTSRATTTTIPATTTQTLTTTSAASFLTGASSPTAGANGNNDKGSGGFDTNILLYATAGVAVLVGTVGYAYYYRVKSNAIKKTAALAAAEAREQQIANTGAGLSTPQLGPFAIPLGVPIPKAGYPYAINIPQRVPIGINGSQAMLATTSGSTFNVSNNGSIPNLSNAIPMYVGDPTMAIPTSHLENTRSATWFMPSVNFTMTDDYGNRTTTDRSNVRTTAMSHSTQSGSSSQYQGGTTGNVTTGSSSPQYSVQTSSVFQTNVVSSKYASTGNNDPKQK